MLIKASDSLPHAQLLLPGLPSQVAGEVISDESTDTGAMIESVAPRPVMPPLQPAPSPLRA